MGVVVDIKYNVHMAIKDNVCLKYLSKPSMVRTGAGDQHITDKWRCVDKREKAFCERQYLNFLKQNIKISKLGYLSTFLKKSSQVPP